MDDDKQDKPGSGDAAKRPPPTIELTASDVSESTPAPDAPSEVNEAEKPASEHHQPPPEPKAPSRAAPIVLSALTGAAAAALVLGVAKSTGWLDVQPPKPSADVVSKSDVETLGARLAKVESDVAKPVAAPKPVTDPALAARLDAVEKTLASLRGDITAIQTESGKIAAALNDFKSASPQAAGSMPAASGDTSALEERLNKIELATAALTAAAAAPPSPPPAPPEDPRLRRLDALIHLDKAVRRGSPYVAELADARSVAGDADALKALDPFAHTGIPDADALSKELLGLLPQLATKPETPPAPSGIVERLQQSFAKLVRVQRTDAQASGAPGIIARATAAAQRSDVNAAKRELQLLPPGELAQVRPWIAKVDGREKALTASEQFTMDTLTAISKPAR
ncbi:MAG: COG4223 family protein [Afipia sp.]